MKIVRKIRENRGSEICFFRVKKLPLRSQSPLRFHYQKRTCNGCLPLGRGWLLTAQILGGVGYGLQMYYTQRRKTQ